MTARALVLVTSVALFASGCASFGKTVSNFIRGKDAKDAAAEKAAGLTKFSDNENVRAPGSERQYKRMNRQKFEEEAELRADAGSLWVMEGQGAYLFSQNRIRQIGDLLNVRIEGGPRSQLQTKVKVISKLLDRLDNPVRSAASQASSQQQPSASPTPAPGASGAQGKAPPSPNAVQQGPGEAGADGQGNAHADSGKHEAPFAVQAVPTRVVEQMRDGSYRVRGIQPFMIGKREYKVIVTGVIRPEDFDDGGVDATKLLDPQFDIVSSRKGASL